MKYFYSIFILSLFVRISAQDSTLIRAIYDEALLRGESYENLRQLCKDVGPRLSGSTGAQWLLNGVKRK